MFFLPVVVRLSANDLPANKLEAALTWPDRERAN